MTIEIQRAYAVVQYVQKNQAPFNDVRIENIILDRFYKKGGEGFVFSESE